MLDPDESEDEHYLLMNGSIFAPRIDNVPIMLMPGEDYCMEIVPKLGLRAFVCFQGLYRNQKESLPKLSTYLLLFIRITYLHLYISYEDTQSSLIIFLNKISTEENNCYSFV